MPDMRGKTVVVTGGNSGIGYETAAALAAMGARVIVTARNADKGRAAVGASRRALGGEGPIQLVVFDLADLASVRRGAAEILEQAPRLDVLVNNAGLIQTRRSETVDGFETTFAMNHLGPVPPHQPASRPPDGIGAGADRQRGLDGACRRPPRHALRRPPDHPPLPGHARLRAVEAGQHPLHRRARPAARGYGCHGQLPPSRHGAHRLRGRRRRPGPARLRASRSPRPSSSRRPRGPGRRSTWPLRPRSRASAAKYFVKCKAQPAQALGAGPRGGPRLWQVSEELVGLAPAQGQLSACGSWSPARRGPSAGPRSRCSRGGATRWWRPPATPALLAGLPAVQSCPST